MKFSRTLLFTTFILGFLFLGLHATAQEWELARDKKEIKVYTRKAPGSSIKDSRTVVIVKGTPEQALVLLTAANDHFNWMDRVVDSKMLKKVSETEFYVYYEAGAPWPVANRDVISKYKIQKHPSGKTEIEVIGVPDFINEKDGKVRIHDQKSSWTFTPLEDERTEVVFFNHTDPAGSIPAWLANSASTDNPFNTLDAFRELIEKQ